MRILPFRTDRRRFPCGSLPYVAAALLAVHPAAAQEPTPGAEQYPFVCTAARYGLGQPLVDNQERQGVPVAAEDSAGGYPMDERGYPTGEATIVGWSRDCRVEPQIRYYYQSADGVWSWVSTADEIPEQGLATTTTTDGQRVPLIARVERGTIDRFIYSIAMLAPSGANDSGTPNRDLWNGRLLFSLQGGVGIGHTQGHWSEGAALYEPALRLGYAVVTSSGLATSTHYNLIRGGRTAELLKQYFVSTYGEPLYTVAIGGSGGAVQQYVYQQNHPQLFDGGVPQYSYPDMVTQTIHIGDCELLEHYFDRTDASNPRWREIEERSIIVGLNAEQDPVLSTGDRERFSRLYEMYARAGVPTPEGWDGTERIPLTECRPGWIGLTPLVMNPHATNVGNLDQLAEGAADVQWTHWEDARESYGVDARGWARETWDNVGVQYGLRALQEGNLSPEDFLRLNALVGGWKHASEMGPEGCPHDPARCDDPDGFDPWSARHMNLSPDGTAPAPRTRGDSIAIDNAVERGQVFRGELNIPLIDWRHYLEHQLDMHNTHQSFAARQRIIDHLGHHDGQLIWFTDARPDEPRVDHTPEALEVLHEWIMNIRTNPGAGVGGNRPERAVDRCWTTDGTLIAEGAEVWAGILDEGAPGPCTAAFPIHSTSRIEAGAPISGDIFRCRLVPVREAAARGTYGRWAPAEGDLQRLEEIFPTGVCDYSRS